MVKKQNTHRSVAIVHAPSPATPFRTIRRMFFIATAYGAVGITTFLLVSIWQYNRTYEGKIYPGVVIDNVSFGGKTKNDVMGYLMQKSALLEKNDITLDFQTGEATIAAQELAVSYDEKLSAEQAFLIGRSGYFLSDLYQKWKSARQGIRLTTIVRMNESVIDDALSSLAPNIDVAPQDALFRFENGKVISFRPSKPGKKLNVPRAKSEIIALVLKNTASPSSPEKKEYTVLLPIDSIQPYVTTEDSNSLGIQEKIGGGTSTFKGSIPGRIHNIELAALRIHGRLIPPNGVFSFNDALGDVSAATGFQPAYIIKDGKTILGDGGGVCQVSTTLFRAALATGLPIVERHQHSYRVAYYEQNAPPGLDATVFAPSYDLKFKNDTDHYILIQAETDTQAKTLAFTIFGTSDGRTVEQTKPVILSQTPPPPDIYQDDPTLPRGVTKQVDWKAWGARVTFDYKVERDGQITTRQTFFSNYSPWQAVFLQGTKE